MTSVKVSTMLSNETQQARDDARQRWSCLMDGEADNAMIAACLREWAVSDTVRTDWVLWHAAGDAMRSSEVAAFHSDCFTARVAAALTDEPAIIARPRSNRRLVTRVMLPGAAVAAAAAMLTVVALPVLRGGVAEGPQLAQQAPTVAALPALPALAAGPASGTRVAIKPPPHMDLYIAAHRELGGGVGMARTTPYLRTTTVLPER
ncbi:MAG: sigma-E factor negative regulatory protein [Burkholderiales bacterium]|nr:sigma-E factor negative regulatory protein [Burkholderiales bacterium]